MNNYIMINNNNIVTSYIQSPLDQSKIGWIQVDRLPYDIDTRMSEYKYVDGKLLSPVEQENIKLKQQVDDSDVKIAMLEESILDLADIALA